MSVDPNVSGKAYALTILSPIRDGFVQETAYCDLVRDQLQHWNLHENSPMTAVPQTYLCRYFVLDDVYTQSLPGTELFGTFTDLASIVSDKVRLDALPKIDHLKSKYLVFSCNFHGDLDTYLRGMWKTMEDDIRQAWQYCYGFAQVDNADTYIAYMKKCQVNAALFFVGANDDPLEEQLKALYLKQELSKFVMRTQGMPAAALQREYRAFIERVKPAELAGPTWLPGQYRLNQEQEAVS
jgi:acyl-CoA-binding protein